MLRKNQSKTQSKTFMDAARELGCDESERVFNDALKKVAQHKPPPEEPKQKPETKKAAK